MKKISNRVLSILMVLVMVVAMLPAYTVTSAAAADPLLYLDFEDGKVVGTSSQQNGTAFLTEVVEMNDNKVLHLKSDGSNYLRWYYDLPKNYTDTVTMSYQVAMASDPSTSNAYFPSFAYTSNYWHPSIKFGVYNSKQLMWNGTTSQNLSANNAESIVATSDSKTTIDAKQLAWHTVKIVYKPLASATVWIDGIETNVAAGFDKAHFKYIVAILTTGAASEMYIDNICVTEGDGTNHTPTPAKCLIACDWVNEVCQVCGANNPYTYTHDGMSMVLENNLNLRFFMKGAPEEGAGHYAKVTKTVPGADPVEVTIPQTDWKYHSGYMQYFVEYTGLAAKEMGQTITVVFYDADGNAISKEKSLTVKQWLEEGIELAKGDEEKAVYENLLIYGAAAQKEFDNYDIENLVTDKVPTTSTAVDKREKGDSTGTSLVCESTLEMRVYFKAEDIQDGYTWKVEYTSVYGEKVVTGDTFNASEFKNDTDLFVPVKVAIADIDALVTVTVLDAEGQTVLTAKDSIGSYIARGGNEGIYAALYNLGEAANAYFTFVNSIKTQVVQTASYIW